MTDVYLTRACSLTGELGRQLSLVLSGIAKAGAPVCSSVMHLNHRENEIKKALRWRAGNCRRKNTDFAQTLSLCARASLLCASRESGAMRSPPKNIDKASVLERNTSERVRISGRKRTRLRLGCRRSFCLS
jgi:hypothetical protein